MGENFKSGYIERENARQSLRKEVYYGRLTVDQALAKAAELGVDLDPSDDPENYDPSELTDWSMPMALSWVAFRTMPTVRSAWQSFKSNQYEWVPVPAPPSPPLPMPQSPSAVPSVTPIGRLMTAPLPAIGQGWMLQAQAAPTIGQMLSIGSQYRDEFKDTPFRSSRGMLGSYHDLVKSLAIGKVVSQGADLRTGSDPSLAPIKKEDWAFLMHMDANGADAWGFRPGVPVFVNILIDRVSLMEAFEMRVAEQDSDDPDMISPPEDTEISKLPVEERRVLYRDFVIGVIKDHPEGPREGCDRTSLLEVGRSAPFKLNRDESHSEYMEAQRLAAVPTWGKKGRRKKLSGGSR